jgi:hypothetical protein
MTEMLEMVKSRLESYLEVRVDEKNLLIILSVIKEIQKSDVLAEPHEVKDMLRILGGLTEDVSMKIEIDNNARKIKFIFQNKEDLEKVKRVLDHIWERTIHIFEELEAGNTDTLRGVGDFSE